MPLPCLLRARAEAVNGIGPRTFQPDSLNLPRVPPDPAGVSQDDLVFRGGTMHVVSTPGTLLSFSVNPHSCLFTGTQQLTWDVTGGTGQFADATGSVTGTVSAVALLARNPDGSCSLTPLPFPRHEVDKFAESGTLSF